MFVIGLTGGIGSGKTTVANLFAERGVPIIDADMITRDLTKPGKAAFLEIIAHFKPTILLADGTLNRTKLREIVFADGGERLWLENLLHPLVYKEIETQIAGLQAPYCIVVIPLLLEKDAYVLVDRILVVDAPTHMQLERVAARDKVMKPHIEAIIKTQAQREHRLEKADDVILNDGKLEDLIPQVEQLHQKYLQLNGRVD